MQSFAPWVDWSSDSKDKQTWGEVLREMYSEKTVSYLSLSNFINVSYSWNMWLKSYEFHQHSCYSCISMFLLSSIFNSSQHGHCKSNNRSESERNWEKMERTLKSVNATVLLISNIIFEWSSEVWKSVWVLQTMKFILRSIGQWNVKSIFKMWSYLGIHSSW